MNVHDLIEYCPAHCDTCDKEITKELCCDDLCVSCEAEYLRNNPDEIPFLLAQIENHPVHLAAWKRAIDLLGDDLEILTLIGECQTGNRSVNQNTIGSLLRLAYSMGKFQGTQSTIAALTKRKVA